MTTQTTHSRGRVWFERLAGATVGPIDSVLAAVAGLGGEQALFLAVVPTRRAGSPGPETARSGSRRPGIWPQRSAARSPSMRTARSSSRSSRWSTSQARPTVTAKS